MITEHRTIYKDSGNMKDLGDESVDLIITSPPYPMIEMWDSLFKSMDPSISKALLKEDGHLAFDLMHDKLDSVWKECFRVLKEGRFACINIGDATRSVNGTFSLYPNHSRIIQAAENLGFSALPSVLWRKQTNAPTKFMGSGMLPAGAYVTLEHEFILIFRKGGKRDFKTEEEKALRRESAIFWEERNRWFSDIWTDVRGAFQKIKNKDTRKRSAAYPVEIPYRLINMYSVKNDIILDPFSGTGTTALAAIASGRSSIGYEIDDTLDDVIRCPVKEIVKKTKSMVDTRLAKHMEFVRIRKAEGKKLKYKNRFYKFPVVTAQETDLHLNYPSHIDKKSDNFLLTEYEPLP